VRWSFHPTAPCLHWDANAEIDRLVYELYGLTAEEIALVEEATGK
jgi:hypothetical protein